MDSKNVISDNALDDMFKDIGKAKEILAQDILDQKEKEAQEAKKKLPFAKRELFDDSVDLDAMEMEVEAKLEAARKGLLVTEENIDQLPILDLVVDYGGEAPAHETTESFESIEDSSEVPAVNAEDETTPDADAESIPTDSEDAEAGREDDNTARNENDPAGIRVLDLTLDFPVPKQNTYMDLTPPNNQTISDISLPTAHPEITADGVPTFEEHEPVADKTDSPEEGSKPDEQTGKTVEPELITLTDVLIDFDAEVSKAETESHSVTAGNSVVTALEESDKGNEKLRVLDMILDFDNTAKVEDNGIDLTVHTDVVPSPAEDVPVELPDKNVPSVTTTEGNSPNVASRGIAKLKDKPARAVLCVVPMEKCKYNFSYALTTSAGEQYLCSDKFDTSQNVKDQWHLAVLKAVDRLLDRIALIPDEYVCVFITNRDAAMFMKRAADAIANSNVLDNNMAFAGKYKKLCEQKHIQFSDTIELKLSSFEEVAVMTANQSAE